MIFTFYSYKGGVGRSMAMANVARWFQLQGLKVVMIDWDLEAPGLESFFSDNAAEREALRSKLGLMDLLVAYKDIFPSLPHPAGRGLVPACDPKQPDARSRMEQVIEILNVSLPPLTHMLAPIRRAVTETDGSGSLWLLPAGRRNEGFFSRYAETVQHFDWADFYTKYEGEAYFEWMRRQLECPETSDVVLIDSRTGVAEMSGICTRQLADVVVIFCGPNDQNVEGVAMMARSFTRSDLQEARGGRRLELVMVPARVDVSEGRPIDLFEEQFHARLGSYLPSHFHQLGTGFGRLRIPYISAYAYAERIAIGDPEGVKGLQDAYVALAVHLAVLSPPSSRLRRQCREALQKAFGLATVFITYLDESGAKFALSLREELERAGVLTLPIAEGKPEAALDWAIQSRGSSRSAAAVVLSFSISSLRGDRLRNVWRRAREEGICLHLITTETLASVGESLPRWLHKARVFEASHNFDEIVHLLQASCQAPRVPFLAPPRPAYFIGRTEEVSRLKGLLLSAKGEASAPVALVGMGGMGKTALAKVICNDDEVIDFFEDGILWISLGAQPDLRLALSKLLIAFEGETAAKLDLDETERRITEHLATKSCLIVLDDVSEPGHLERIPRGGPACRLLITVRARDIATRANAVHFEIGGLNATDAQRALVAALGAEALDPAMVATVVQQLDGSPLALALVNQTLRHTGMKQDVAQALADLGHRLEEEGLTAIDPGISQDPGTSISAAFMLAIEGLESADRARLPMLASLPTNRPLDVQEVAGATGMSLSDTEQMLGRLAAKFLLEFDAKDHTVLLHALTHALCKSLERRQRRVETTRMAAAVPSDFMVSLSYRREDSANYAAQIYDRLTKHFGFDRIFFGIEGVSPGQDFVEAIRDKIASAKALIVLIGPRWIDAVGDDGVRLLDNANDFVRIEIATAMKLGLRVMPVLVGGARKPIREELPAELADLVSRHELKISDSRFNQDIDVLIEALEFLIPDSKAAQSAIDKIAEDTFKETLETLKVEEADIEASLGHVFRELIEVDERGVATRRRASLNQVADGSMAEALVNALIDARLLVKSQVESNQPVVEVTHEAIFTNWNRLSRWIEEHVSELRICRGLTRAALDWKEAGAPRFKHLPDRATLKQYQRVRPACSFGKDTEVVGRFLSAAGMRQRTFAGILALVVIVLSILGTDIWLRNREMSWNVLRIWTLVQIGLYDGPPMMVIPAGSFEMGDSDCTANPTRESCPQHPVVIQTFEMGKFEVTFDEYSAFLLDSEDIKLPPNHEGWGRGSRPVINVNWDNARDYIKWLNKRVARNNTFRLPSEAEWEYACRAKTKTLFYSGDTEEDLNKVGWYNKNSVEKTHPVGEKKFNDFGLYDMHGNVWEWCQHLYDEGYCKISPKKNPQRPQEGSGRAMRGGSWSDDVDHCRSAGRFRGGSPDDSYYNVGFRLSRSVALGP